MDMGTPCFCLIRQIDGKEKMVAEIEAMLQSTRAARHGCATGGKKWVPDRVESSSRLEFRGGNEVVVHLGFLDSSKMLGGLALNIGSKVQSFKQMAFLWWVLKGGHVFLKSL